MPSTEGTPPLAESGPPVQDDPTAHRRRLGGAARGGAVLAYGSFAVSKLLVFVTTLILARMLTPGDFGVVGYALVVIGYLDAARDLGVGAALIARPQVDRRVASTAFQISVGWGLLLTTAVFLGAPLLGDFFDDPRAVGVTQALSFGFLLSTLGSTHGALLYRELAFGRRVVPDVVEALVKVLVSIGLALGGWGYWSLVVGQLAGSASFCLTTWVMHPFRPRLEWDGAAGRWLLGFGSTVVASSLLWGLLTSVSFLIVGRELGAVALGIYLLAYRLPQLALMSNYSILSTVLFPVYARLQGDLDGLRRGYLLGQRYMALVMIPAALGLAVVSPLFVSVFYGPAWVLAGPIMQIIAVRCAIGAIGWHASDIAKALGRARLHLILVVIPVVILVPSLLVAGRLFGLVGLALVYAAGALISTVLRTFLVRHVMGLSAIAALRALEPALIVALAVVVASQGFLLLSQDWPDLARLIGATVLGGAAYLGALYLVGPDLMALLPARFRPRRATH